METQLDEQAQQASHLPVDALHVAEAGTELPVEPEDVDAGAIPDEPLDVLRNGLVDAGAVDRGLVGIRDRRGYRRAGGRYAPTSRHALGADRPRALPARERGARPPARPPA